MSQEHIRRAVIDACAAMLADGLSTGTSGNISVAVGDDVLVTPSGVPYDAMQPDDLCTVTRSGDVVDAPRSPSSETPMHLLVYRSTDAGAVVHTHSPFATAVGLVVDELPAVHYAIHTLGGPVRVAPYATFGTDELAEHVAAALRGRTGALLRNHGVVTYGDTLDEAYDRARKVEWLAELHWRASLLGRPATLSEAALEDVRQQAAKKGYRP